MAVAPGAGYPKISRSGGAFVSTSAAATAIGEGYWGVVLSAQETGQLGTLVVVFASGQGVEVQVRELVSDISKESRIQTCNSQQAIVQQLNGLSAEIRSSRDLLAGYLQALIGTARGRKPETK